MFKNIPKYLLFKFLIKPLIYLGLGVNVFGVENLPKINKKPYILVANHNSHIDTLLLMSLFCGEDILKLHPVAAADYFCNTKLKSFFFKTLIGLIPLSRHVIKSKKEELFKDINLVLKNNQSIIIYPEGTRGNSSEIKEFKTGVAHIAKMNPEVEVVPIYINGPDKILPKTDFLLVPFICDVYIGESICYDNTSTKEFTLRIKMAVQQLKDMHKRKEEL